MVYKFNLNDIASWRSVIDKGLYGIRIYLYDIASWCSGINKALYGI